MAIGDLSNLLKTSLFLEECFQIRLFDFSKSQDASLPTAIKISKFIDYLPSISPPSWSYKSKHFQLIAEHLDAVTRGEIDRLAIFLPPRHGKSQTITVRYPIYRFEHDPTFRALITGYNERIARRFNRQARNIAQTRILLAKDKKAMDEWETIQGGGMVARGVGTPPTGYGFNLILIDDPIKKREEAESETYREKLWDWYTDDLYTRLEPGGAIVLTLTRWHHDDLAAQAVSSEPNKWIVLRLPALAEEGDLLKRKPGQALWPERFDKKALARIREVMKKKQGEYSFESVYQQNPTPREGAFFKVSKLEIVRAAATSLRLCRAWDLAATEDSGDYTAGVLLGADDATGLSYVLDVARGQWDSDERNKQIKQTAALDGRDCLIQLPQDPGQAGKSQSASMIKMLAGYAVAARVVTGSKIVRADPLAAQINAGNIKLLESRWNGAFIEELRQFPQSAHDDQVDAAADAFTRLTEGGIGVYL